MPPKIAKIEVSEEEIARTKRLMEDMELKKLKRAFMLTKDRKPTDEMVEKQKKVIKALSLEQHNLLNNLSVMQTERRCNLDQTQAQHIIDLFAQGDTLDLDISKEKKYIMELEEQMRKETQVKRMMESGAKGAVSEYLLKEENQHADRSLSAWKSRLHAEQVQLGHVTQENAELRKKVEFLLRKRKRFNELFEEMMTKLNKGKKIMKDIVERSTMTFKSRDEVARKIQALKERDAADLSKRREEMQDLEMRLNEEQILTKFKNKVIKSRLLLSGGPRATRKATLQRDGQEHHLRELQNTIETINQEAENLDVVELVHHREAENFSIFNYNNELRCQLEVLTEETVKLMRQVQEEQENEGQLVEEHERQKEVMGQRLADVEVMANDLEEQLDASHRIFDRLLSKINTLFDTTECDTWPLEQLLGENKEVTMFNYKLFLDLVESKLVELLNLLPLVAPELSPVTTKHSTFIPAAPKSYAHTSTVISVVMDKKVVTRLCPDCSERRRHSPPWS